MRGGGIGSSRSPGGQKALIIVAAQADGKGIGRIRLRHIPDTERTTLHGFIAQSIEPGSTVVTDGLQAYREMEGYVMPAKAKNISPRTPNICCRGGIGLFRCSSVGCWALIKARLLGNTSKMIWMSSRSGSIGASRPRRANCSAVWPNSRFRFPRFHTIHPHITSHRGGWSPVHSPNSS